MSNLREIEYNGACNYVRVYIFFINYVKQYSFWNTVRNIKYIQKK